MNESSRGTSVEYHLDFFSFLTLQGFWNCSSAHSLIRYVDNEPAAIIITCTDPDERDAYIMYWGSLPQFRTRKIAQTLFDECCTRLSNDGFVTLHGVSVAERPVKRYRFIQALPQYQLLELRANSLMLPAPDPAFQVRKIAATDVSQLSTAAAEPFDWSQRPSFLRRAASHLQLLGAFSGDTLKAYAVIIPDPPKMTTILDFRSSDPSLAPGYELLRHISDGTYPAPFAATPVFDQSYNHRLLTSAGFAISRRFSTLTRDLRSLSSPSIPAQSA